MKFGEYLRSMRVEALLAGYVNYDELARMAETVFPSPIKEVSIDESKEAGNEGSAMSFQEAIEVELLRVNNFAAAQLERLLRTEEHARALLHLREQVAATRMEPAPLVGGAIMQDKTLNPPTPSSKSEVVVVSKSSMTDDSLVSTSRQLLLETYQRVFEFKQMCELNLQGFQKLLKKRAKALKKAKPNGGATTFSTPSGVAPAIVTPLLGQHPSEQVCDSPARRKSFPRNLKKDDIKVERFYTEHRVGAEDLARRLENIFADAFAGGEIAKAQKMLRVFQREAPKSLAYAQMGFFAGACAVLALMCFMLLRYPSEEHCPACMLVLLGLLPAYRLTFVPIVWCILWSGLCAMWRNNDINYPYILDINPRTELGTTRALKLGLGLLSLWLSCCTLFLFGNRTGVDPLFDRDVREYTLWMLTAFGLVSVAPPGFFYFHTRRWIAISAWRTLVAPCREVHLRENFFADVLTSMARLAVDAYYTTLLFSTGAIHHRRLHHFADLFKSWGPPLMIVLPYWLRFCQCFRRYWDSCVDAARKRSAEEETARGPRLLRELTLGDPLHLVNAGKYMMSVLTTLLSALGGFRHIVGPYVDWTIFRKAWLAMLVLSALYAYAWDIIQDMGLVTFRRDKTSGRLEWYMPTEGRAFASRGFVVWVMASNFVGRMAWAATIVPTGILFPGLPDAVTDSLFAIVEVLRRAQWTLLRIENEHANNPNHYRSIVEVPSVMPPPEEGTEKTHFSRAQMTFWAMWLALFMLVLLGAGSYYEGLRVPGHQLKPGLQAPGWATSFGSGG